MIVEGFQYRNRNRSKARNSCQGIIRELDVNMDESLGGRKKPACIVTVVSKHRDGESQSKGSDILDSNSCGVDGSQMGASNRSSSTNAVNGKSRKIAK
jgi:hypothetical protein